MLSGTYVIDGDESPGPARFGLLPWAGVTWPSVRYPSGSCIVAFWPDVMPIPTQGGISPITGTETLSIMSRGSTQEQLCTACSGAGMTPLKR